ncbi:MAG: DUF4190 domain-containing protein [Pseudonocardiaceae bacterium]
MTTPPNPGWPPESERGATTPGFSGAADPRAPSGQPPHYSGAYGYPPVRRSTNGFAIASLVLGIIGVVFVFPSIGIFVFMIPAVLALVFGYIARNQIKQHDQDGAGMATAGIVLGWVAVGLYIIFSIIGLFI